MDSKTVPKTPLQVLSLGMPRTGTASMQAALRLLGYYDVHHGFDLVDHPSSASNWEIVTDMKFDGNSDLCSQTIFNTLLGHCAAVTDMPCAFFAEDLVNAYPEAKVILVERNYEKWHASVIPLIHGIFGWKGSVLYCLDYVLGYSGLRTYRKLWLGYFHASNALELVANLSPVYSEHYNRIKRLLPADRLLEYNLGSGWQSLCDFLGKDEPPVDFPWINEAAALQVKMHNVINARLREVKDKFQLRLYLVVAVCAVYIYWSRLRS